MLRFGPETGPIVVVALALFEEANRMRAFAVTICRLLAKRGVASVLPDLPGQGESLTPLEDACLLRMRDAMEALVDTIGATGRPYAVGLRSGALLDVFSLVFGRWHFAPLDGDVVLRDLLRTAKAGGTVRPDADRYALMGAREPLAIAGNLISGEMAADLQSAAVYKEPGVPRRVVRLDTDPAFADRHVSGPPLWRRAEPDNDPAFAALLADDIADWIAICED